MVDARASFWEFQPQKEEDHCITVLPTWEIPNGALELVLFDACQVANWMGDAAFELPTGIAMVELMLDIAKVA